MPTSVTRSQEETERLAEALAARLRAGDVLLLSGPLGAGKTAFVRGLARGLDIDPDEVSSPTFTLLHEYGGGRLRLFHADLYRLGQGGAADLGLDDTRVQEGVLAVEWPDRPASRRSRSRKVASCTSSSAPRAAAAIAAVGRVSPEKTIRRPGRSGPETSDRDRRPPPGRPTWAPAASRARAGPSGTPRARRRSGRR